METPETSQIVEELHTQIEELQKENSELKNTIKQFYESHEVGGYCKHIKTSFETTKLQIQKKPQPKTFEQFDNIKDIIQEFGNIYAIIQDRNGSDIQQNITKSPLLSFNFHTMEISKNQMYAKIKQTHAQTLEEYNASAIESLNISDEYKNRDLYAND